MDLALSLLMFTALASLAGAAFLWRRDGRPGRQVWLMLVLAAVLLANALIWALPSG